MKDSQIVALYWQRDQQALQCTQEKYGPYCYAIASRILSAPQDAEESVNDTYWGAWNAMPPHKPDILSTFLGKLTRRISLKRWRDSHRQKRGSGQVPLALEELSQCIPDSSRVEDAVDARRLQTVLKDFVHSLPETERRVFVCRYWYLAGVGEIAQAFGFTESKVKSMLYRSRKKLAVLLEQEGLL